MQLKKTAAQIKAEKESNPKGKRAVPTRKHYIIPNQLRVLREQQGLSLADVQAGCGVGTQTVGTAEEGGDISLSRALALANFYEMKVEEIWNGEVTEEEYHDEGQESSESGGKSAA